jgi:hypothetical protein
MSPNKTLEGFVILGSLEDKTASADVLNSIIAGTLNDKIIPALFVIVFRRPLIDPDEGKLVEHLLVKIISNAKTLLHEMNTKITLQNGTARA